MSSNTKGIIYFQFNSDLDYPVYLKVNPTVFDSNFAEIIRHLGFTRCNEKGVEIAQKKLAMGHAKILHISEASPKVAQQIGHSRFEDKFGPEAIIPKSGYKIYKYAGVALLVYSFATSEWQLGCMPNFGSKKDEISCKVILNRFLSWSLCSSGVIGFWGAPVEEGIVVMRQARSNGECVFIDVHKNIVISTEGNKSIRSSFQILRLDKTLKNRTIRMSREEVFSFLSNRTTFFDYNGLIVSVRQMIQMITKISQGVVHPYEDFRPKVDLSY